MNLAYQCPLCQHPLIRQGHSYRCEQNHQFDIAKEGYVNLLPVQMKNSRQPGDNLDMVQARRTFLAEGHYRFLAEAIAGKVKKHIQPENRIYDLGCGEGYYTHCIAAENPLAETFGVDISKSAIRYAAKRYPDCHFSVASIKQTPFETASAQCLISVFAPLFEDELARLAAPGARLFTASPGPWHLKELKARIYETVNEHTPVPTPAGFERLDEEVVTQVVTLEPDVTLALVKMTPFAWKFTQAHLDELGQSDALSVTLSFYITEFIRKD